MIFIYVLSMLPVAVMPAAVVILVPMIAIVFILMLLMFLMLLIVFRILFYINPPFSLYVIGAPLIQLDVNPRRRRQVPIDLDIYTRRCRQAWW